MSRPAEPEARSEGDAGSGSSASPSLRASGSAEPSPPAAKNSSVDPLAELLAANRELVDVNRQIAASLASLERLYAEDLGNRQKVNRRMAAQFRELRQHPLRSWPTYVGLICIPALIIMLPVVLKWLNW